MKDAKKIINDLGKQPRAHTVEYEGTTITIKKGQYGPYFNYQGKNYSIYKTYDADNLQVKDLEKIISYKKGGTKTSQTLNKKKGTNTPKKKKEVKKETDKVEKKKVVKKKKKENTN